MTVRQAIPFMRGVNYYVPNMAYAIEVAISDGYARCDLGAPIAANATGILSLQSIATAGNALSYATTYTNDVMGRYGRNVTVVASGAATSAVTIDGFDYLGQAMTEVLTLNGATAVQGQKAFRYISNVTWAATAGTTINVGWGNRLGLPYRATLPSIQNELVAGAAPTGGAGTLVAGATVGTTQTSTTVDPRGYYTPNAGNLPDGTRTFLLAYPADLVDGLHGNRHFKQ